MAGLERSFEYNSGREVDNKKRQYRARSRVLRGQWVDTFFVEKVELNKVQAVPSMPQNSGECMP